MQMGNRSTFYQLIDIPMSKYMGHARFVCALTFVCTAFLNAANAQDYRSVIKDIRKKNENAEKLHIVMRIEAYENEASTTPFYKDVATMQRNGHQYFYRVANNEMLLSDRYMIMVDKELKQISCTKRDLQSETEFNAAINLNVDSVLSLYGNPAFIGRSADIEHYRFTEMGAAVKSIDLFIDKVKSVLTRMDYRYQDEQHVAITFEIFDLNAQMGPDIFTEGRYVKIVNGKVYPAGAYQKFDMIDTGL